MRSIVVSVCAKTADELIRQIKQADEFADMIEVRFDCLDESDLTLSSSNKADIDKADLEKLGKQIDKIMGSRGNAKILMTLRSPEQGGQRASTFKERDLFWRMGCDLEWADFEEDMFETSYDWLYERIFSYHDFNEVPQDLERIYQRFSETPADIIKIAVHTHDISDGLPLWKLLKKPGKDDQRFVPIAMGEAGKWTRILGLAYGAPLTYAALETGKEVAPGQISAEDLRDVYRVKELNEQTEIFGVIGDPVKFSLSPYMQNAAFKAAEFNAVFIPFEVKDLDSFIRRFLPESGLNIKGLSVTIPHKQAIMKYLDEISETAQKVGAVNTVKIVDGKLYGFNTDAPGFIAPLKKAYGELKEKTAAVLGAGGGARAVIYALQEEGVKVTVFARDTARAETLGEEFHINIKNLQGAEFTGFNIVINATPLGMKGKFEGQSASTSSQLKGVTVGYDLVYTPEVTPFIQEARTAGVPIVIGGAEMLVAQGAKQFEIWTGNNPPPEIVEIMKEAVRKKLR